MNERDQFIQSQVTPMLMPGEQVLHTAYMVRQPGLLWQILLLGGLLLVLMTKAYYAVFTNRRLILIRTSQGFFKPKMTNIGVEQYDVSQMTKCTTSGFANNRSMTFLFRDGSKQTLRIAPWVKFVSGNKAFLEGVPALVGSPQLAAGAVPAGALPAAAPTSGGFAPGAQVVVAWSDGNRYPATIVQAQGEHYLCAMPDGQQQWVPAPQLSPA